MTAKRTSGIDWSAYALHYDSMAQILPEYQENVAALHKLLDALKLPDSARIADMGAGTGNYSLEIARRYPNAEVLHIDSDGVMNEVAKDKYRRSGTSNVRVIEQHIQRLDFEAESLDLIVCVNVLYATPPQKAILGLFRKWLKPAGALFLIDFGREQKPLDWGFHLLSSAVKKGLLGKYLRFAVESREVIKQSFRGRQGQRSGSYWMHSTDEFAETLRQASLNPVQVGPCYRGYADMAICYKGVEGIDADLGILGAQEV